jgi:multicomponent Na+:H+ antiporter subunit E
VTRPHLRGPRGLGHRIPAVVWLVLVWVMLWGTWTWANLITGLLVATGVMILLPLPPVVLGGRLHPLGCARYAGRFALDLVVSSVRVALRAVLPGPEPRSAVATIRLRSRSDLLLTVTAESMTLIPGSLAIDVDRTSGLLSVHIFDVKSLQDVEDFKRSVLDLEARVIRAIGPHSAIRALDEEEAAGTVPPAPARPRSRT